MGHYASEMGGPPNEAASLHDVRPELRHAITAMVAAGPVKAGEVFAHLRSDYPLPRISEVVCQMISTRELSLSAGRYLSTNIPE